MNPYEKCRTCLQVREATRSIYTVDVAKVGFKHITAIDVLQMFTDITISKNDGFPDQICTDCLLELQRIYSFKLKCEKSNSVLMGLNMNVIQQDAEVDTQVPQLPYTIDQRVLAVQVFYESKQSIVNTTRRLQKIFGVHNDPCKRSVQALITKFKKSGSVCDVPISSYDHKRYISIKRQAGQSVASDNSIGTTQHHEIDTTHCERAINKNQMDKIEITEKPSEGLRYIVKYSKSTDEQKPVPSKIEIKQDEEHAMDCLLENIKTEPDWNSTEKDHNLINREGSDSTEKNFECFYCSYKSSESKQLERHIIDIHMEQRWCKICREEFICTPIQHCATHFPPKVPETIDPESYQCSICLKSFQSQDAYKEHMRVHTGRFKCDFCSESFLFDFGLKHHLKRKHKFSKPSDSGLCTSNSVSKISSIELPKSDNVQESYKCEICSDVFSESENLTEHLKNEHSEKFKRKEPIQSAILLKRIRLKQ